MNQRWDIAPVEAAGALAQILSLRGFRDPEAARRFLHPKLQQLADPFELPNMRAAVERVLTAIAKQERIVIYGDYDVDGVTSSALLTRVLRAAGAQVKNFLPLRVDEGYGLSADGIARCVSEHQPQLLLAVDCGTSSAVEIAGLKKNGVDVIVLDHHEPPAELPDCLLVNPKIVAANLIRGEGEPRKSFAATNLASVGIAFKFAHALLKQDRSLKIDLREHLDLVAVGTIADLVPLTGENRILVKAGLARLPGTTKVGLRALLDVAGIEGEVSPGQVGFRLGPRLNAAGRLADAMAALELLLTADAARAAELADELDQHNAERQLIEARTTQAALEKVTASDRVLVVADEAWHPGVIGIVASRLVQQFHRPAIVIGAEGKGSCRSVTGYSLVAALAPCADLLVRYGGHEMAAGLTIVPGNVPGLRERLNAAAGELPGRELRIEAVVELADLDAEFFAGLAQLEPFGMGNPTPVLAVTGVRLAGAARVVGEKHLKFAVTDGTTTVGAIWWRNGDAQLPAGALDIAFVPELNEFRGVESAQLNVRDVRAASV